MNFERIAAIGDIHAEHEALSEVLDFVQAAGVDAVLAVGDIVDGTGDVNVCCRLLEERRVRVVRGNHERWFLAGTMRDLAGATPDRDVDVRSRAFLAALPSTIRIPTACGDALLCHATGEDDMHAVGKDDFGYALETNDELQRLQRDESLRLLVCGHSHRRMVRRIGGLTVVNAGTLHRDQSPGFAILDLGTAPTVTFFDRLADGAIVTAEVLSLG